MMKDQIKITIDGNEEIITKKGIIISDLIKILGLSDDVIAATIDGEIVELSHKISEESCINFIKISDKVGGKIYRAGLQFVYIVALKELYGKSTNVRIKHSIDKGIYTEVDTKLKSADITKIKNKMKEIIDLDITIEKVIIPRKKAIKYFEENNEEEKIKLYNQMSNDMVTFYELMGYYNYFYYFLPTSTGVLKKFDLSFIDIKEKSKTGIVLRYPKGKNNEIPEFNNLPKVLDIFKSYEEKINKIGVLYAADVNEIIIKGKTNEFVQINELMHSDALLEIVHEILLKKSIKMILVGGPSCSGKTTTSKKIALRLKEFGKNPFVISLDDYFKDRSECIKDENGNYDFEKLDAIDIKLFNKQMSLLLSGEEVIMPTFNFLTGVKEYKNKSVKLNKDDIIIIEGLHTLNEKLTSSVKRENKFKIYASPFTPLGMDRHNHISTTDLRVLRRLVRDNLRRGYNAEHTLSSWKNMRSSEEKYVFPYQKEADAVINSALIYEINALKTYAEPLLYSVGPNSENYEESLRLINFMKSFFCIPDDGIPNTSVLREFIGKSYFD